MAQFEPAITSTLQHEGGYFHNPTTGECVNFGITAWTLRGFGYLPPQPSREATPAEIEFIRGMSKAWAAGFYLKHYWGNIGSIKDQSLANKVFDVGVNQGQVTSIQELQRACNLDAKPEARLKVDGELGPETLAVVNIRDPITMLAGFRSMVEIHYRTIATNNPALSSDLNGWLARLQAA